MKSKWNSKTLWVAVGAFVVAIVTNFTADPQIVANVEKGIALALPVLMYALRIVTKAPVK